MTPSEWADEARWLSLEASQGGKWKTRPYQREPLDAVDVPGTKAVVCVWCSQGGKTELPLNLIGRHIQLNPGPILYMAESEGKAETFSRDRLTPMERDCPSLRGTFSHGVKDASNTVGYKKIPGGHITMVGAQSALGLSMRPIRILICDEFLGYPLSAGNEGSPLKLADMRTAEFFNAIRFYISSPRWASHPSKRLWDRSDQRRWFVLCPDCKHEQFLKWAQVDYGEKDAAGEYDPRNARYVCEGCGSLWDDRQRWGASRRGRWRPTETKKDGTVVVREKPFSGYAGFHLPAMAVLGRELAGMVDQHLEARGDPEAMQVFTNTVLAEFYEGPETERLESHELLKRAARDGPWVLPDGATVPEGPVVLSAGIDVHPDRLYYEVVGWSRTMESWSIRYGEIFGDVRREPSTWEDLERQVLLKPWRHASGVDLYIRAAGIDTGFASRAVEEFASPRLRRGLPDGRPQFVFGLKGDPGGGTRPVWPGAPSRGKKGRARVPTKNLWIIGTTAHKDQIAGYLGIVEPGPGYCHFPPERSPSYYEGLTSEHVDARWSRGRRSRLWVKRSQGRVNEPWDCRNYAYVAVVGVQAQPFDLDLALEEKRLETAARVPSKRTPKAGKTRRRRSRGFES